MKNYLFALLFLAPLWLSAQGTISGLVLDEDGLPLPGATVIVTEMDRGVFTDVQGRFMINNVQSGMVTLEATYLGYEGSSQQVQVSAGINTAIEFRLNTGVQFADEVLILGDRLKGQAKALNQQRSNGNITNIVSADQIGRFPDANVGDAMKRIPGITMQND